MKKALIIIIIAAILVGGGITLFVLMSGDKKDEDTSAVVLSYSPGEYFVTNLSKGNDGVTSLIRLTMQLEIDNEEYLTALIAREAEMQPRIRDAVVFILRNMTAADISAGDKDNQAAMRKKIVDAVNDSMRDQIALAGEAEPQDHFIGVVISDFVIQ